MLVDSLDVSDEKSTAGKRKCLPFCLKTPNEHTGLGFDQHRRESMCGRDPYGKGRTTERFVGVDDGRGGTCGERSRGQGRFQDGGRPERPDKTTGVTTSVVEG